MKVLLIQPPIEDYYITEIRTYPLGLLYLASYLKQNGYEVRVLDGLNPLTRKTISIPKDFHYLKSIYSEKEVGPIKLYGAYYRFGLSNEEIVEQVVTFNPDIIGITSNFTAYFETLASLCSDIKLALPHSKIILGGYHANVFKEKILQDFKQIDYISTGPNEASFLKSLNLNPTKDVCFSELIPDRSFILANNYKMHKQNFTFITATRGCSQNCSFCTVKTMHGSVFHQRPVEKVIEEMLDAYTNYNIRVFDFEDDNLSLNRNWFMNLLDKIIITFTNNDLCLYAMNGIAVNNLDEEVLLKMKNAGFKSLNISLVSAQDETKKKLLRPFFNDQFEKTLAIANKLEFDATVYLILGLPKQRKEEIESSLHYLSKFDVLIAPSIYYPPPGVSGIDESFFNFTTVASWKFARSTSFSIETDLIKRSDLVYYFQYIRLLNFIQLLRNKHNTEIHLDFLNSLSKKNVYTKNLSLEAEEIIGIAQLKHFMQTGEICRIYK